MAIFIFVVCVVGAFDLFATKSMMSTGFTPVTAKLMATLWGLILNFAGRKYLVFPEKASGSWKPQHPKKQK